MNFLLIKIPLYLIPSIGVYEALELRDGGSDYLGKGVSKVGCCLYIFYLLIRIYSIGAYIGFEESQ